MGDLSEEAAIILRAQSGVAERLHKACSGENTESIKYSLDSEQTVVMLCAVTS